MTIMWSLDVEEGGRERSWEETKREHMKERVLDGHLSPTYAWNDILIAHSCPAMVSQFSFRYMYLSWIETLFWEHLLNSKLLHSFFRTKGDSKTSSSLVNNRSSGLGISISAILSGRGSPMPILSRDFSTWWENPSHLHLQKLYWCMGLSNLTNQWSSTGTVKKVPYMLMVVMYRILLGDKVELSAKAPILRVSLPQDLLRDWTQKINCLCSIKCSLEFWQIMGLLLLSWRFAKSIGLI